MPCSLKEIAKYFLSHLLPHILTQGRPGQVHLAQGGQAERGNPASPSLGFYFHGGYKRWHQFGRLYDVKGEIASSRQRCRPGGLPRREGGD